MADFAKTNSFITRVCAGTHANAINANTDVLKIYLTNTTPVAATHNYKGDLTEIANTNISASYPSGGKTITYTVSQTTGTITVTPSAGFTISASGGAAAAFRWLVLYNDTPTTPNADPIWGWWDYGSSLPLADGETFTVTFSSAIATFA